MHLLTPFAAASTIRDALTPRRIAILFTIISVIGLLPALYGLVIAATVIADSLTHPAAFRAMAMAAFILLGLAQAVFYARRVRRPVRSAPQWWASTVAYNVFIALVLFAAVLERGLLFAALVPVPHLVLAAIARHARRQDR